MAEGASDSREGAFHTPTISLSAVVERTAEAALTAVPVLTGEAEWIEGLRVNGEPLRREIEGEPPIAATNQSVARVVSAGRFLYDLREALRSKEASHERRGQELQALLER